MNFRIKSKGGGGSFPIQKIMLQIFAIINVNAVTNLREKAQHRYPKRGGGGQRPFGLYPKIHPLWNAESSFSSKRVLKGPFVLPTFPKVRCL